MGLFSCSSVNQRNLSFRSPASILNCKNLVRSLFGLSPTKATTSELSSGVVEAKSVDNLVEAIFDMKTTHSEQDVYVRSLEESKLLKDFDLDREHLDNIIQTLGSANKQGEVRDWLKNTLSHALSEKLARTSSKFDDSLEHLRRLASLDLDEAGIEKILKESDELKRLGFDLDEYKSLAYLFKGTEDPSTDKIRERLLKQFAKLGSSEEEEFIDFSKLIEGIDYYKMSDEEVSSFFKDADLIRVLGLRKDTLRKVLAGLKEGKDLKAIKAKIIPDFSTMGIEFEGAIPGSMTYGDVLKKIGETLEELYPGTKVTYKDGGSYSSQLVYKRNDIEYVYDVGGDSSLSFPDSKRGVEIASPILRDQKDVAVHFEILSRLKKIGMDQRPDQAGIHIHYGIDAANTTNEQMLEIYELFYKIDGPLRKFFFVNENRGYINLKNMEGAIADLKDRIRIKPGTSVKEPIKTGTQDWARPNAFNATRSTLRYVGRYGTLESRFFNSSLDTGVLEMYTDFTIKLMEAWKSGNSEVFTYVKETPADQISMGRIAELVDARLAKEIDKFDNLPNENINANAIAKFEKEGVEISEDIVPNKPTFEQVEEGITSYRSDRELGLVARKMNSLSEEDFKKAAKSLIENEYAGEFTLQSIGKAFVNENLSEETIMEITSALIKKSRGDAFEGIVPGLYGTLGPDKAHKFLEDSILPSATDLQKMSILNGIKARTMKVPSVQDFVLKNFVDKKHSMPVMELVPSVFLAKQDLPNRPLAMQKLILKDIDFSESVKQELMNYCLLNHKHFPDTFNTSINFMLSTSSKKDTYFSQFLTYLNNDLEELIPGMEKWIQMGMDNSFNSRMVDSNAILNVFKKWDGKFYNHSHEGRSAGGVFSNFVRKIVDFSEAGNRVQYQLLSSIIGHIDRGFIFVPDKEVHFLDLLKLHKEDFTTDSFQNLLSLFSKVKGHNKINPHFVARDFLDSFETLSNWGRSENAKRLENLIIRLKEEVIKPLPKGDNRSKLLADANARLKEVREAIKKNIADEEKAKAERAARAQQE
ncbi:MAG: hypothetical protein CME70_11595 [Halobacteriovorax sp.]|nr:hypothetical protein [Halobacteriovorax sp.]|tara:strand:- start:37835 stop:40954 length:3120 start_codon:yes stop_codon:yes gene_type:complete